MADFSLDHPYPVDPATLFATLTRYDYLAAKYVAIGFTEVEIIAAGPTRVEAKRTTEPPVPGYAKRVLGGKQRVHEVQEWTDGPEPRGTFRAAAPGTPVTITGTFTIRPDGAAAMLEIRGQVSARVPIVGGKIADLIAGEAARTLEKEYTFTQAWLNEH
jgi:hypothetical protein